MCFQFSFHACFVQLTLAPAALEALQELLKGKSLPGSAAPSNAPASPTHAQQQTFPIPTLGSSASAPAPLPSPALNAQINDALNTLVCYLFLHVPLLTRIMAFLLHVIIAVICDSKKFTVDMQWD